jgi:hypothetical protein
MSIKRFDVVKLTRSDRVSWLSGPAGKAATPKGGWIVVAGVGDDKFLLARAETLIQIPIEDVFKIADYELNEVINTIKAVRTKNDLKKFANLGANQNRLQDG